LLLFLLVLRYILGIAEAVAVDTEVGVTAVDMMADAAGDLMADMNCIRMILTIL
jgi:hypothetical protein